MFAARLSPIRGKAGLASQDTTGSTRRSTTHYGAPTAGAADQAGPDDTGSVISPAFEWGAKCDVGHELSLA